MLEVPVVETQVVKKGQVLMRIADSDQRIALAKAEANLLAARREFSAVRAQADAQAQQAAAQGAMVTEARAQLAGAQSDLSRAQIDYDRRRALEGSGAVSANAGGPLMPLTQTMLLTVFPPARSSAVGSATMRRGTGSS